MGDNIAKNMTLSCEECSMRNYTLIVKEHSPKRLQLKNFVRITINKCFDSIEYRVVRRLLRNEQGEKLFPRSNVGNEKNKLAKK